MAVGPLLHCNRREAPPCSAVPACAARVVPTLSGTNPNRICRCIDKPFGYSLAAFTHYGNRRSHPQSDSCSQLSFVWLRLLQSS